RFVAHGGHHCRTLDGRDLDAAHPAILKGVPRGAVSFDSGSIICTSTCGITVPTVETRRSRSSVRRVIVDTGEVSVMPYMIVTSDMFISTTTRFITSTGHGAPAMIPVRSDERS